MTAAGPEINDDADAEAAGSDSVADRRTVALITTGGTIAEKIDPATGGAVPALSGTDLLAAVPGLSGLAEIALKEFSNVDSSHMTPAHWARLSRVTDEVLAHGGVAGAVITHGTDTMEEAAYFLDVTLRSDKPVVFTGAMHHASSIAQDGPANVLNAVAQVLSPQARDWGVTVTLNSYVNAAREARKTQTTNLQTFTSGEKGYLGYVFEDRVVRFNDRPWRTRLALPETLPDALPDVPLLYMYAGSDGRLVRHAVDSGAGGLVVEGLGAGNVNEATFAAIQYAQSRDVPVVISSRVYFGPVGPVYGAKGGGRMLKDSGCILAGDLMGPKARLLLMIGLACHGNDRKRLSELFAP